MTTLGSPVYGGNSNNPLWLSTNPSSISLAGTAPLVLTNIGGVLAENGVLSAPTAQWSIYPATSNTIKMDTLGNQITNDGNSLYYNGNLIANASDIQNISDWSLYNAISDVDMTETGYPTLARGGVVTTSGGYRTHTFTSALTEDFADPAATDYLGTPTWNGWVWTEGGIAKNGGSVNGATGGSPAYYAWMNANGSPYISKLTSATILIPSGTTMTLTFKYSYQLSVGVPPLLSVSYDGAEIFTTTTFSSTDWLTATATFTTTSPSGQFVFSSGNGVYAGNQVSLISGISLSEAFRVSPGANLTVSSLVVGGGGGGGSVNCDGGGGGGGAVLTTSTLTANTAYPVVVGSGGGSAGAANANGGNGGNSTFNGITGTGGGGGGGTGLDGVSGGCGGGGSWFGRVGGTGTQGGNGGSGTASTYAAGGGGGGMGGNGANSSTNNGGNGGAGQTYTIGGYSYLVAGGGGGGGDATGGTATAGGGRGGAPSVGNGANGTANTGGGGGGGGGGGVYPGGIGGSGIVLISYPVTSSTQNYKISGAGDITSVGNITAATMNTGSLTSSGAVSGTSSTFTTSVTTPFIFGTSNLQAGCISNLIIYGGSNLTANAPTISNGFINTYSILGNKGSDYTDFCITNLSNKGGKGGQINLTADAGSVTISGTTYGIGGLINITANSPLTLPYNATSAIKLSAASILSYAGAVSPVGSLAGYNYIQGTLGVNIVAGSASSVPNVAGTNYLYGANGTKIRNYLYTDTIANDTGVNLYIQADTGRSSGGSNNLYLSNVKSIIMEGSNGEAGSLMSIDGSYITSSSNKGNSYIKNFAGFDNIGYINSPGAGAFGSLNATLTRGLTLQGSSLQPYIGYFPGGRCDLTLLAPATPGEAVVNNDIVLNASCNIKLITSNSGQVQVTGTMTASNITSGSNLTLTASSNLNLNGSVFVNGAALSTTSSNWAAYPATQAVNLSNFTISNAGIIAGTGGIDIRSLNASSGAVLITAGASYHRMALQTGSALNISSSNTIELQGQALSILSPVNAGNNTISNIGSLVMSSSGNLNMSGNVISNVAAISSATGLQLNSGAGVTINSALSMGSYGISNCSSISNLTGITINPGAGYPLNINSFLSLNNNVISNTAGLVSPGGISIVANSNNATPGTGFFMTVGSNLTPYHQISAQQGQGLFLGSSNFISIGGTTTYLVSPTVAQSTFSRQMSSSNVAQPIIQFDTGTFIGTSGTLDITIPTSYTGSGTYVVQLTMRDSPATVYALPTTGNTFTITWSGGTSGTQHVMWTTFGT